MTAGALRTGPTWSDISCDIGVWYNFYRSKSGAIGSEAQRPDDLFVWLPLRLKKLERKARTKGEGIAAKEAQPLFLLDLL